MKRAVEKPDLRAALDALLIDVGDAALLRDMIVDLVDELDRDDRVGIARLRVLVRFLANTVEQIQQKSRGLWEVTS